MLDAGDDFYFPFPKDDPNNPIPGKAGDRASFAASSHDCNTSDPGADCVDFNAPDLVPTAVATTTIPATLVGTNFTFLEWTLLNQGTTDGNAENDVLRHGFYLCPTEVVENAPVDSTLDLSLCAQFADFVTTENNTLPPGGEDPIDATLLTVPDGTLPGLYDVVLYVDDLFQVSEFIEVNNYAAVPITVVAELLENGGFETPVITISSGWQLYPNGTQGLDWSLEWLVCGAECEVAPVLELQTNGLVVPAREGVQYAELDSHGAPGNQASLRIYRDFDTCDGAVYTLSYSWAKRNAPDEMTVSWGEVELDTHGSGAAIKEWNDEGRQLIGDGTTMRLEFVEVGPPDTLGMLLDAVSLVGPLCPQEEEESGGE
jgi:hypothetical protein